MLPGLRENLFAPISKVAPCFGSVSPVSMVKSPSPPEKADIGIQLGLPSTGSLLRLGAPVSTSALVEAELLSSSGTFVEDGVVEAAASCTGVVEVAARSIFASLFAAAFLLC